MNDVGATLNHFGKVVNALGKEIGKPWAGDRHARSPADPDEMERTSPGEAWEASPEEDLPVIR